MSLLIYGVLLRNTTFSECELVVMNILIFKSGICAKIQFRNIALCYRYVRSKFRHFQSLMASFKAKRASSQLKCKIRNINEKLFRKHFYKYFIVVHEQQKLKIRYENTILKCSHLFMCTTTSYFVQNFQLIINGPRSFFIIQLLMR